MLLVNIGSICMAVGFAIRAYIAHIGEGYSIGLYIGQTLVSRT